MRALRHAALFGIELYVLYIAGGRDQFHVPLIGMFGHHMPECLRADPPALILGYYAKAAHEVPPLAAVFHGQRAHRPAVAFYYLLWKFPHGFGHARPCAAVCRALAVPDEVIVKRSVVYAYEQVCVLLVRVSIGYVHSALLPKCNAPPDAF